MGRKKATTDESGAPAKLRRIGIELPDTLSLEISSYCEAHPLVNRGGLTDLIREKARAAAEAAVLGNVENIAKGSL